MSEADDDWTRALDKFRGVIEPVTVARVSRYHPNPMATLAEA